MKWPCIVWVDDVLCASCFVYICCLLDGDVGDGISRSLVYRHRSAREFTKGEKNDVPHRIHQRLGEAVVFVCLFDP